MNAGKINLKWSDIKMAELDLTKLITHFAQSNKADGKSVRTVSWYTEMLLDFVRFITSKGKEAVLAELNATAVREFIIYEQGRGLSPFTVQCRVRALKAFASWLFKEGYTTDNLLANIKLPKAPLKIVQPLSSDEIQTLVSAQNPLTEIGCRDIAILITLLDTGIRLSESASILFQDTHIEEGYLKVTGKGNKERIVPIGALTQKMLWRYVFHFRPEPTTSLDNYLFLTLDGKHLLPNAVKLLLNRWGKRAGVPRLHAHLCRHTYATNFLTHKCGDVFRLKLILGHTTLEMVNRYVHFASAQDMIQGRVGSALDEMGIKGLRGYKIDRSLRSGNNHAGHP
jgi:site-specific recombinase XerD